MSKINYFVANTPFQVYSIEQTVKIFFSDGYLNVIYTTFPLGRVSDYAQLLTIRRGVMSIVDLIRMKREIEKQAKGDIAFFIPHLSNLISNYFFNVSIRYNKPINVYYEGTAQFCPWGDAFSIRVLIRSLKRKLISLICGMRYEERKEIFPKELTTRATFYTPEPDLCIECKEKRKFNFPQKTMRDNNNILFISSNIMEEDVIDEVVRILKKAYTTGMVVYVKPHFEVQDAAILKLLDQLRRMELKVELLDKKNNIELYYDSLLFSRVLSQECSSALINIKLIFKDQILINVLNIPSGFEKISEYYGFTNGF